MLFIPEYGEGSVFVTCRLLRRLDNSSSIDIKRIMYDGVVVLTNVLYIFLLVLILTLEREWCLAGYEGDDICVEMLEQVFESFLKKRQFYQGLSSK